MNSEAANAPRCQDRPGTYEAWYVTVCDPAARRGFWLRYTMMNPASGAAAEAQSALWAFAFDRDHPETNWGGKVTYPLRALRTSSRPFGLRLEGAVLERDGCSGQIHTERGSARWVASNGAAWRPHSCRGDQASRRRPDRRDVCRSPRGQPLLLPHGGGRPRAPNDPRLGNPRAHQPSGFSRLRVRLGDASGGHP